MLETKDDSLDGKDRDEWNRAWRAMPHRRLTAPPKAGVPDDLVARFGVPVSVTASQDPPEFSDRVGRESETCPVCGRSTAGSARLPGSIHPKWASGLSVGVGVWLHGTCFESLPFADEPAPIPW